MKSILMSRRARLVLIGVAAACAVVAALGAWIWWYYRPTIEFANSGGRTVPPSEFAVIAAIIVFTIAVRVIAFLAALLLAIYVWRRWRGSRQSN